MCIIPNLPTAPVAFLFSFLALTFAWSMARTKGETSVVNLVLAGVMTSAIFSSLLALIQFAVDSKALQSIVFWMMGSLNTACWSKVHLIILPIILGTGVMLLLRWRLNALSMSEEEARALGVHPERYKLLFITAGTLATSAAVSVAGIMVL
jgi:iron complex transport system permease protein